MAAEDDRLRRLSCCEAEPPCVLCPLLPENAHRPLAELEAAGLRGRLPEARAELAQEQGG